MGSNLLTFMNLWICRKVEKKRGGEGLISLSLSTTMIYDIYHDIFPLSLSLSASLPSFHFIIFHSVGDYPFNDHIITSGRVFFPLLFINIFFFCLCSLWGGKRERVGGREGGRGEFEWSLNGLGGSTTPSSIPAAWNNSLTFPFNQLTQLRSIIPPSIDPKFSRLFVNLPFIIGAIDSSISNRFKWSWKRINRTVISTLTQSIPNSSLLSTRLVESLK